MTTDHRSIRYRPASADDIPAILDIWFDGWWDAHGAVAPEALRRHRDRAGTSARIAPILPDITVAELGRSVAGFVSIEDNEVVNLYVDRSSRGSGLAPKLLAEAEAMLAAHGKSQAILWCAAGNDRAYRFYLREGWRDEGVRDHDVSTPDGPVPVPCHRMVKDLPAGGGR